MQPTVHALLGVSFTSSSLTCAIPVTCIHTLQAGQCTICVPTCQACGFLQPVHSCPVHLCLHRQPRSSLPAWNCRGSCWSQACLTGSLQAVHHLSSPWAEAQRTCRHHSSTPHQLHSEQERANSMGMSLPEGSLGPGLDGIMPFSMDPAALGSGERILPCAESNRWHSGGETAAPQHGVCCREPSCARGLVSGSHGCLVVPLKRRGGMVPFSRGSRHCLVWCEGYLYALFHWKLAG